jgi:hypothetical protein
MAIARVHHRLYYEHRPAYSGTKLGKSTFSAFSSIIHSLVYSSSAAVMKSWFGGNPMKIYEKVLLLIDHKDFVS